MAKQTKVLVKSPICVELPFSVSDGFIQRRLDMRLTPAEALAFRRAYDGLRSKGATLGNGRHVDCMPDVVRWIAQHLFEQMYRDAEALEIVPARFG